MFGKILAALLLTGILLAGEGTREVVRCMTLRTGENSSVFLFYTNRLLSVF